MLVAVSHGHLCVFQAQDSEERERWIRSLEDSVLRHNQQRGAASPAAAAGGPFPSSYPLRASTRKSINSAGNNAPATIEDFDKKLGETDSYLELLLSQVCAVHLSSISALFLNAFLKR